MENPQLPIKQEPREESVAAINTMVPNYNIVKIENYAEDEHQLESEDQPEYVELHSKELDNDLFRKDTATVPNLEKSTDIVTNDNMEYICNSDLVTESNNYNMDYVNLQNEMIRNGDGELNETPNHIPSEINNVGQNCVESEVSKLKQESSANDSSSDESDENTCNVCKVTFLDQFDLQIHFKSRRLEDRKYKCCNCGKTFRDNTQLKVHARKHTGEQPFECKVCGKKFSVNGNLNKHMRIHTGERRYECDTCERKFTQFAHLEDHMRTHSGDRPFVCDYCNAAFKTKARLRKHRKAHEEDKVSKRSVKCPFCWKMLKNMKQLTTHMSTHDTGAEPFACTFCDKSFDKFKNLQAHQKIHSGLRGYQCTLCEKAFASASHLRRHINSHSGLRPYNCNICMRGFPSQQNLKRHMMTHTGEKPYQCDVCERSFLTLENLNRHKRTHTGEKPFSCDICGRFFAHSTTAKEHRRVHTGDKPFGCSLCEKRFSLSKMLYKHIREKHPHYFPEFKKINSLPPNMRKIINKVKKETTVKNEPLGMDNFVSIPGTAVGKTEEIFYEEKNIKSEQHETANNSIPDATCNSIPFIKVEKKEMDET